MNKTSLYEAHLKLNAKMAEFAGFEMPIQYAGVKSEVQAVREACGVFDVSHMGEFFVTGPDAQKFVDYLITNDFLNAQMNKAVYSPLCREDGTTIDDLIAYKLEENKVLICVNAANIDKDWNWIESKKSNFNITLENKSEAYSLLAVQGPETEKHMTSLGFKDLESFEYYSAKEFEIDGDKYILARTGYTGEDGFEIFASHDLIQKTWAKLMDQGATPCGLASRDVLRLEVCYPLYGHELNDNLTPLDAALKWTVKLNKNEFIGKGALADHTPTHRLAKLSIEKGIPREGYDILNDNNEVIGKVTSGTMSVVLGKGIALGLIKRDKFPENKVFKIQIRKNIVDATYHTKAFVNGGHK